VVAELDLPAAGAHRARHLGTVEVSINARHPVDETAWALSAADVRKLVVDLGSTGVAYRRTLDELIAAPGVGLDTVICRKQSHTTRPCALA
jgi:hypothetical protein